MKESLDINRHHCFNRFFFLNKDLLFLFRCWGFRIRFFRFCICLFYRFFFGSFNGSSFFNRGGGFSSRFLAFFLYFLFLLSYGSGGFFCGLFFFYFLILGLFLVSFCLFSLLLFCNFFLGLISFIFRVISFFLVLLFLPFQKVDASD